MSWRIIIHQFKQMFIHGIDSDILEIAEYKDNDVEKIIHSFLRKYQNVNEKNRFHLVLNNAERMYLDWAQYMYKKSRNEVKSDINFLFIH